MEVPRRPQPTFTLALHKQASALLPLGSVEEVGQTDQMEAAAGPRRGESSANSQVSPMMEPPQPEGTSSSEGETKLFSQDSFCEDGSVLEERSAEEPRRKSEEEEAAKGRSAQKQLLAVEELVQSERNYLRMLQVSTVTIRSNLMKLQVPSDPPMEAKYCSVSSPQLTTSKLQ